MKKMILAIAVLLVLIISTTLIIKINTKPKAITGEATTQNVALNITLAGPPELTLHSPANGTYLTKTNLLLNFSSSYADSIWYNLDNNQNITISSSIYFNVTPEGSHVLYLFANNSYGVILKNVSFKVDYDMFLIIDGEYETEEDYDEAQWHMVRHNKKGESTNFLDYSYEELQNLSSIILDNVDNGKIKFEDYINITNDSNLLDNTLDLNSYTDISFNKIEINSTALPNLNKSATLYLYNLTFNNPRILKDGEVCPSSICVKESYSGGTLIFNVDGFSVYSIEETPTTTGAVTSGGKKEISNFSLNKENIQVKLKQGETKIEEIIIKNTGDKKLEVFVENSKLKELLSVNQTELELETGESKAISLNIIAKNNTLPSLYIGKLIINAGDIKKEILVSIEIETKESLFDIKVNISKESLSILPGDNLTFEVNLYNLKKNDIETSIEYIIKNENGEIITQEKEIVLVKEEETFIKTLKTPESILPGKYVLYIKVSYNGKIASSSELFSVLEKEKIASHGYKKINNTIWVLIFLIMIILIVIAYKLKSLNNKRGKLISRRK